MKYQVIVGYGSTYSDAVGNLNEKIAAMGNWKPYCRPHVVKEESGYSTRYNVIQPMMHGTEIFPDSQGEIGE